MKPRELCKPSVFVAGYNVDRKTDSETEDIRDLLMREIHRHSKTSSIRVTTIFLHYGYLNFSEEGDTVP